MVAYVTAAFWQGWQLDKEGEVFSHKEREEKGRGLKLPKRQRLTALRAAAAAAAAEVTPRSEEGDETDCTNEKQGKKVQRGKKRQLRRSRKRRYMESLPRLRQHS